MALCSFFLWGLPGAAPAPPLIQARAELPIWAQGSNGRLMSPGAVVALATDAHRWPLGFPDPLFCTAVGVHNVRLWHGVLPGSICGIQQTSTPLIDLVTYPALHAPAVPSCPVLLLPMQMKQVSSRL